MKNATVVSLLIFFCLQTVVTQNMSNPGAQPGGDCPVAMPPNRSIEWTFTKKELFMGCSVGLKYAKNALADGALPRTPLGELTTLPRPPSR